MSSNRDIQYLNKLTQVITENAASCLFMMDERGYATYMNPSAEKITGYKLSELNEKPLHDYVHYKHPDGSPYPMHECPLAATYAHLSTLKEQEEVFVRKDGSFFPVMFSISPILDDGQFQGAVLEFRDITAQKQVEQDLLQAKEAAEKANSLKTSFLAHMSHEIRTPMTAVLGFSELLRTPGLSEEERSDALERIENSGRSLLKLIDDILDISKVEAGKIEINKSQFSPVRLMTEVVSLFKLQTQEKGIELNFHIHSTVPELAFSDFERVRQVLTNLIANAVKFTSQGAVVVNVRAHISDDHFKHQMLAFEVRDSGIGISKADQNKLFQPFSQADNSISKKFGGSGLGLALSQRLARQLGGDLYLQSSEVNKGSSFVFYFEAGPFESFKNRSQQASAERVIHLQGNPQILVVDDVVDNQILLKKYLESAGASVEIATSGFEAVKKAGGQSFDMILMDLQMPEVDGLEATRKLRQQGYQKPILAVTAHAMSSEAGKSLEAGCNEQLTKPLSKQNLLQAVSRHLQ